MENNFLAMEKNFSTAWSHFLSFSQANMNFLAWDKKYFVRADGQGIWFFLGILKKKKLIFYFKKVTAPRMEEVSLNRISKELRLLSLN